MIEELKDKAFEPQAFFDLTKDSVTEVQREEVQKALDMVQNEYVRAKEIGQVNLAHKIAASYDILQREMVLIGLGFNRSVSRQLVIDFIREVKPKDSVKVVELSAYPRIIPSDNAAQIKRASDLNVFDEILIVYTDFTGEKVKTKEQEAMVARNRDPIALGVFHKKKIDFTHDRMYLITDWVDEHCDLTFDRMITKMDQLGFDTKDVDRWATAPKKFKQMLAADVDLVNQEVKLDHSFNPKEKSIFSKLLSKITGR